MKSRNCCTERLFITYDSVNFLPKLVVNFQYLLMKNVRNILHYIHDLPQR